MAQRRMFSPDIVESEEFISMPLTSQALYFHLGMNADDDGFIQPRKVMRSVGFADDDLKVLLSKRFLLPFETGVVVIKHWLIHNMIRADRYKPTRFIEEKSRLFIKEDKGYTDKEPLGLQSGNQRLPQVRLGKVRLGKESKEKEVAVAPSPSKKVKKFIKPTVEEVRAYCTERKNKVDAENFVNFYASKGWLVGKTPMKDWKACVRTWEQRDKANAPKNALPVPKGKYEGI